MQLTQVFIATTTYVLGLFSSYRLGEPLGQAQIPLFDIANDAEPTGGPIFKPPTGGRRNESGDILCDYSAMGSDWKPCSTSGNRGCWLNNTRTGQQYNITTDYEDMTNIPIGTHRNVSIMISDGWINADGQIFEPGKFFWNMSDPSSYEPPNRYPGPWIQACWGDTVHVTVHNDLRFNGTSVHWHGIRQWHSFEADGVPGITQCPIAPRDKFTYSFRVTQYGSSWYHSHYSLQYADGAAGPMTLHGPSSDNWDIPKFPIMMTDWGHNSAFDAIWTSLANQSTLLNRIGNLTRYNNTRPNTTEVHPPYHINVTSDLVGGRPVRYLLRLINISFESMFVFAIDNHLLTVIANDFVPIQPYNTTSVRIGIGQRYNAILTANPIGSTAKSFWMRAYRPLCFHANFDDPPSENYELVGIVYYDGETQQPSEGVRGWPVDDKCCSDEPSAALEPVVPRQIGSPTKEETDLVVNVNFSSPRVYPLAGFSIGGGNFNPLRVNYSHPMILNLTWDKSWDDRLVVYPEPYGDEDWVYLLIQNKEGSGHPIHLHGHDFAILAQSAQQYPAGPALKFDNPPRRDVVLLPGAGWVMIAFQTDNPGPWLVHCHIAQHASFGLAMQVLERRVDAEKHAIEAGALAKAQTTCDKWNHWYEHCRNWWYDTTNRSQHRGEFCDKGEDWFSPDSGI